MIRILGLQPHEGTDPQEFTLFYHDDSKPQAGYVWSTKSGTEDALRGCLKDWPEQQNELFVKHCRRRVHT